jgi:hypothetical protein
MALAPPSDMNTMRRWLGSIGSGLVGALALAGVHWRSKRRWKLHTPRLDQLGERAVERLSEAVGRRPPHGRRLERAGLAANVALSALYFAALVLKRTGRPILRGTLGGFVLGLATIFLPPLLALGKRRRGVSPGGQALTVGSYTLGGLLSATAWRGLGSESAPPKADGGAPNPDEPSTRR